MIIDELKKANITALKEKDTVARAIFSVLLNKIMLTEIAKGQKGQGLADAEVVNIIQKSIKELADEKDGYTKVGNLQKVADIEKQTQILNSYLPTLLSEEEIFDIINKMDDKSIGAVMKKFKMEYNGQCDMALVRDVLKKF